MDLACKKYINFYESVTFFSCNDRIKAMQRRMSMNITGIIAEYNPLHRGHCHHMEAARRETDADYIVVVMSGDYVQRGEPAVFHKHLRAKTALLAGADLVLELPWPFSCSSAEDFAASGAGLLHSLGIVNVLSFGSESGDLDLLREAADLMCREPAEYRRALKEALAAGQSFPAARQAALERTGTDREKAQLLSSPNNILGAEYLRALERLHSTIRPHTIPRAGDGYHETAVTEGSFASATALRRLLREGDAAGFSSQVPENCRSLLRDGQPLFPEDFSRLLNYTVLTALPGGFARFSGFSRELSDRLAAQAAEGGSWQERVLGLKTRNYTYARISRALLSLVLNLSGEEVRLWKENCGPAPFARILGFRREAAPLLSALKKSSSIPIISKAADAGDLLSPDAFSMFRKGILASQIREAAAADKYGRSPVNEYRRQIEIL